MVGSGWESDTDSSELEAQFIARDRGKTNQNILTIPALVSLLIPRLACGGNGQGRESNRLGTGSGQGSLQLVEPLIWPFTPAISAS